MPIIKLGLTPRANYGINMKHFILGLLFGCILMYIAVNYFFRHKTTRKADYPVNSLIISRWSPRAMSGKELTNDELMTLFEAARWAPSSYNLQPWKFIYALKNTPEWDKFFDLLVPFNKSWAKNASVLILALSNNKGDTKTNSLSTGAAVQNLALQGHDMNLIVHGVEGFDYDKARKELNIPQEYKIESMYVVGKPDSKEVLPKELQEREVPSDRKKIVEFVYKGSYGEPIK